MDFFLDETRAACHAMIERAKVLLLLSTNQTIEEADVLFGSIRRFFCDHPTSVGETYLEHGRHALSFGWTMLCGSTACFIHAVFPSAHTRTGSQAVIRLHDRMVINRRKQRADEMSPLDPSDSIAENI